MEKLLDDILHLPHPSFLYSFSAIDKLLLKNEPPILYVVTTASLIELAKNYTSIEYRGMDDFDALIRVSGCKIFFRSIESIDELPFKRILPLTILYDVKRRIFIDKQDAYHTLRDSRLNLDADTFSTATWEEVGEIAVLLSRYHYELDEYNFNINESLPLLPPSKQQIILSMVLTGQNASRGLFFLMKSGFIAAHWPELHVLNSIDHSKEYHPEGNVWDHTLAALSHRKSFDLTLALGLFLHDIGKSGSERYEGKQFHQHAQIGSFSAVNFLRNLEFSAETIDDVRYLVHHHMLPAAIEKIPIFKTEKVMSSPLFPQLLELFRCDLASSFRELNKYYNACKWYRRFLKNSNNPFRTNDGKKDRKQSFSYRTPLTKSV